MYGPHQALLALGTACWLFLCAVVALRRFEHQHGGSIYLVIAAHSLIFGLPLVLDVTVGQPGYAGISGFHNATTDPATFFAYLTYVALCPPLWFRFGAPAALAQNPRSFELSPRFRRGFSVLCCFIAVSPVIPALISPSASSYLRYAVPIQGFLSDSAGHWHHWVSATSTLSVLACGFLLAEFKSLTLGRVAFVLAASGASCWFNGKRAIVAIALVILGYALWTRGILRGRRLKLAVLGGLVALFSFSFAYQRSVRNLDESRMWADPINVYESVRLDFFRDDRVKMTLFAELYPDEMRILEHRGQSLLFYATFLVPRPWWSEKPWPYSTYFTCAAFRIAPPRPLGWAMTTSWLEEAVANLGWLGVLLGPLTLAALCRIGDSFRWAPMKMLSSLIAVLLLAVELISFMTIFVLWVALVIALSLPATHPLGRRRRHVLYEQTVPGSAR